MPFDPFLLKQPAQCAVQSPGAEADASVAHLLNIFQYGIAVPRLLGKAEKYEEDRLRDGRCSLHDCSLYDMSLDDILGGAGYLIETKLLWR